MVPPSNLSPAAISFTVATQSGTPIYQQLVDQIIRMVASGQLSQDQVLPSVREVAHNLAINPMTVSKAYSQLETAGVLTRLRGVGMAVAAAQPRQQHQVDRINLLRPTLEQAALEAAQLGIDRDAALALFDLILKGKK